MMVMKKSNLIFHLSNLQNEECSSGRFTLEKHTSIHEKTSYY